MSARFKAACIQLNSAREVEPNIAAAAALIRKARDAGADLVMTPEVSDMMEPKRPLRLAKAKEEAEHPMLAAFRALARETGAYLLLGSAVVRRADDDGRIARATRNSSTAFMPCTAPRMNPVSRGSRLCAKK